MRSVIPTDSLSDTLHRMSLSLATLTLPIISSLLYWTLLVMEIFRISPTSPFWWVRRLNAQRKIYSPATPPSMLFQTNISIKLWSHTNLKMYRNTKTLCHRGQTLGTWHGMLWMRRRAVWTPSVTWRLVHQSQSTGKVTHLAGSSLEWRSLRKYHNSTETTNNNILKSLHTIYVIID